MAAHPEDGFCLEALAFEHDLALDLRARPQDGQLGALRLEQRLGSVCVAAGTVVDLEDLIAGAEARFLGWSPRDHGLDGQPAGPSIIEQVQANPRVDIDAVPRPS